DAVWHAARAHDGRGPATRLSLDVPRALGRADIRAVSVDLYRGQMAEPELAVVPPLVFAAARAGDAVALGLVQRQADEVVAMATAAARRLDLDWPVPVVLGGSVLAARHALLLDPVEAGLRAAGLEPRLVVPADPPVVGAALLGLAAHLGGPVPADVEARLRTALGSAPTTRTLAVAEEA
ncbi:MAG TPA: N-acetylglucosamine kinase, partial [Cellulomonas sp.]